MTLNSNVLLFKYLFTFYIQIASLPDIKPGHYPEVLSKGVNLPDCGLKSLPQTHDLLFSTKCFKTKQVNTTYVETGLFGKHKSSGRLYKDILAEYAESPWSVRLAQRLFRFITFTECTGVLISLDWVITAAHCYQNFYLHTTKIHAGSNHRGGYERAVAHQSQWFPHPNFTGDYETAFVWDIALIKLDDRFTQMVHKLHYRINPVCLPTPDRVNWHRQEDATFFGWGLIHDESAWLVKEKIPGLLRRGEFYLQPMKDCYSGRMLCHRRYNSEFPGLCSGDSGGGLVQYTDDSRDRAVLIGIGIGSWNRDGTDSCSNDILVNAFIPIAKHLDWILKTIKDN